MSNAEPNGKYQPNVLHEDCQTQFFKLFFCEECQATMFCTKNLGMFAAITYNGEMINVVRHREKSTNRDDLFSVIHAAICN